MPSSYTTSLRLEMQAAGENLNTWGAPKLNNVIARVDAAIAGMTVKPLIADYVLTSSNGEDEARSAILKFTGAGAFTVTIPSVSKIYVVWNACSGDLTLTTGGGTPVVVAPGMITSVICDGATVRQPGINGGSWKTYVDSVAFNQVDLPAQTGNGGKFIRTNGSTASWQGITTADISNYSSDQAAKAAAATARAIAFAVAFS